MRANRKITNGVRRASLLKPGQPFNPFAVPAEEERVLFLYADKGYYPRSDSTVDTTAGAANVEFRFEALNVLNQVTFFGPNTTPNNTSFGQVTAQRNVPRHMQMTLRFQF